MFTCTPGNSGNVHSLPAIHNLARAGTLRRKLSIPNPINYFQLAELVDRFQANLLQHMASSSLSLTTPKSTPGVQRAIDSVKDFGYLPIARSLCRASSRYVLQTDIGTCYPSIYTHVIPWALHTKQVAKQNQQNFNYLGNVMDLVVRNAQDRQTLGIPIGPDCSLVIAEIILSSVDATLAKAGITVGFRFLDDYEFGFGSYSDAEQALATLQGELSEYELDLNPRKTQILDLPLSLERPWAYELRNFQIRNTPSAQQVDLIAYFSRAYDLCRQFPEDSVLRFALGRTRRNIIHSQNWDQYQAALLHVAVVESGALPLVVDELFSYHQAGYHIDRHTIADVFHQIIRSHARVNHGSEVAWAIWGSLLLMMTLDHQTADLAARMADPIVAILTLDGKSKGLVSNNVNLGLWSSMMTSQELYADNWLLSYEANIKGWLPSNSSQDHVAADPGFGFLKQYGVSFYDQSLSTAYKPTGAVVVIGPSGEEQPAEEASG